MKECNNERIILKKVQPEKNWLITFNEKYKKSKNFDYEKISSNIQIWNNSLEYDNLKKLIYF